MWGLMLSDDVTMCGNDLERQGEEPQPGQWSNNEQSSWQKEYGLGQMSQKGYYLVFRVVKATGKKIHFQSCLTLLM